MTPYSRSFRSMITILTLVSCSHVLAEEHTVAQKGKAFSVDQLTVKAGDTVNFRNDDPFFHNVFSLSDAKTFDLGSYPQGEAKTVTFDTPGEVEVECAIHPSMKLKVNVEAGE